MILPLWDIDGTLLPSHSQTHLDSFVVACQEVFSVDVSPSFKVPEFHGKVDPQILVEVLERCSIRRHLVMERMGDLTGTMAQHFVKHNPSDHCITRLGIPEILKLLDEEGIIQGVLTGNLKAIGKDKLSKAMISHYFRIEAFSDGCQKRLNLIDIAKEFIADLLLASDTKEYDNYDGFGIIGDTPRDIKFAKQANLPVAAIATGIYAREQLEEEKPDLILDSLESSSSREQLLEFILRS